MTVRSQLHAANWENACQRRKKNIRTPCQYGVSFVIIYFRPKNRTNSSELLHFPYQLLCVDSIWINWTSFWCIQSAYRVGKHVAKISAFERCTRAVAEPTTSKVSAADAPATRQSKYAPVYRWPWSEFSGEFCRSIPCDKGEYWFL